MASRAFGSKAPVLPHLTAGPGGISGEVADLRRDVEEAFVTIEGAGMGSVVKKVFTDPAAGGVAALEVATASQATARTVTSFLAPGVAILAAYGRNVTITTGGTTPADAPASAVVTGTYKGVAQTETLTVPQTAATVTGTKPFDTVTSVVYAAGEGTGATNSIGIGNGLGVTSTPVAVAGGVTLVHEVMDGTVPTAGTLTAGGLYTPNTAPDGAHDYAVYYEAA
jgi:hypothetical protein